MKRGTISHVIYHFQKRWKKWTRDDANKKQQMLISLTFDLCSNKSISPSRSWKNKQIYFEEEEQMTNGNDTNRKWMQLNYFFPSSSLEWITNAHSMIHLNKTWNAPSDILLSTFVHHERQCSTTMFFNLNNKTKKKNRRKMCII